MQVNIYYGGRGIIDDPTLTALETMQTVLEELRVDIRRYNLFEYKNTIPTLPQTLKDADGIILACTVEWYGIGGYMSMFLDACWQFGDKEKIAGLYMMPLVMSRTYGEREAQLALISAWEILGGKLCSGLTGYVSSTLDLELNPNYKEIVEKRAESFYRAIHQKLVCLPSSNRVINQKIAPPTNVSLSPQESEQLSEYVTDDNYVQTQKEDIQELANMFRGKLESESASNEEEYLAELRKAFHPQPGVAGLFSIHIEGKRQKLILKIAGNSMTCMYGTAEKPDVEMDMTRAVMEEILGGRMTFQRAFMSGGMKKMKGDFRILGGLDQVLVFA